MSKGHVIPRGHVGPSLLAMIPYAKFGEHQPLNRQSGSYAREGVDLDVSTLADHVGACTAALNPIFELIRRHVLAAERIHGDDTTMPVLAPGKTITGSDRGGERAAAMYTLIATAKLNGIDPQAWLAELLRRIADHPVSRVHELLPWHWEKPTDQAVAA